MTTLPGSPPAGGTELGADTMDLLRFATIGSVDDGKSTLIGRLLFDTRQLFDDQLTAIETASERRGLGEVDLSFVTDGLRAEREQGITIDVAYRYAATPHRKFVIADCPGHVQYTRNMATGASTADLALVLVDATSGLREQSRRHVCIAALLGVDQLVVCANKMDLVGWDRSAYQRITDEMDALSRRLGITSCTVIPISALHGDNVVERSDAAPWYDGPTVLDALESAQAGGWAAQHTPHTPHQGSQPGAGRRPGTGARLPVQWVLRQPEGGRSYAGMVNGGPFRVGDAVVVLPQGATTSIRSIETADGPLQRAEVGLSVSIRLAEHLDVSRGDLIAAAEGAPVVTDTFEATVCWFKDSPLSVGDRLRLKHTTRVTPVVVESITGTFDVNDLKVSEASELKENEIGVVTLRTATPLAVDPYEADRITGSFVLIDEHSFATIAAGMVGLPGSMTEPADRPRFYPVSLDVSGRRCLVVGGGPVAARKARALVECGGVVTVVASSVGAEMESLAPLLHSVERRPYATGDASGHRLVVTATGDRAIDGAVYEDAESLGVWVNGADDLAHSSFILPAVHRDGAVTVSVSTSGSSPALASWLRGRLATHCDGLGTLAQLLGDTRDELRRQGRPVDSVDWRSLLEGPLPDLVASGHLDNARAIVEGAVGQ